ncbi:MAG TPA: efflux RND transporter periplasmic adaptor subunit [Anaerolineae bacterium]|nr:efflux RND transporter periplasmic adaptor subunit [Anaerolineae bacterium]
MKNRMRFVPLVIILVVAALGVYWLTTRAADQDQGLKASGTIEATDVSLSPEIGGRVIDVAATDGDAVQKDQALVRLDDTLLQAQLKQVEANIQALQAQQRATQAQQRAAQANYDLLKSGPLAEQIQAAQDAEKTAEANVTGAQAQLAQLLAGPKTADIAAAEAAVAKAASDVTFAQQAYDGVVQGRATAKSYGVSGGGLGQMEEKMRSQLEAIQANYDVAVKRLAQLKQGATQDEIDQARARVAAAQAQQSMAQAQLEQVQKGARTEQLAAAQAQIDAATAQIDGATAQIEAAKAQAAALQAQIDKLTLHSPLAGVVLKRNIEPGEVVGAGSSLMTLGDTTNLFITVYIPENRYGEIVVGQPVLVKVDSFPNEEFSAKVTRIADQAEFTPRNVQTAEGRATTVFAVKLAVDNAGGKLKPGMPADVYFDEK